MRPPKKTQKRKSKPKKKIINDVREKINNTVTGWWKGFIRPPAQCPQPPACKNSTCGHPECFEDRKQYTQKPATQKNLFEDFKMPPACKEELEDYSEDSQQC